MLFLLQLHKLLLNVQSKTYFLSFLSLFTKTQVKIKCQFERMLSKMIDIPVKLMKNIE